MSIEQMNLDPAGVVHREVEFLVARCVTMDIPREKVELLLAQEARRRERVLEDSSASSMYLPYASVLQTAQAAQAAGDVFNWEKLCRRWLELQHGVTLGEVVRVHGWSRPRDLLLDRFTIDWFADAELPLAQGLMTFEGPSSHTQRGKMFKRHTCSLSCAVEHVQASSLMKNLFPHRFA